MIMWNATIYDMIRKNPDMVCWKDFACGKSDFPDYASVSCPIACGSDEHKFWNRYFSKLFGKKYVHYDFIARLLSSFMLAC